MKRIFSFSVFLISCLLHSQQKSPVLAVLDTAYIRIGEPIEYKITVPKGEKTQFPTLDDLRVFERLSSSKVDTSAQGFLIKKYRLTSFDTGRFFIPKQAVFLRDKIHYTDSLMVEVASVAVDLEKQKPFANKPIAEEPFIFDDYRPYFIYFYLFLGAVLIAFAAFYLLRKYRQKATPQVQELVSPYQEALKKLSDLDAKELWQNNQIKGFYIELTEIVRTYIGREVCMHTMERTTAELVLNLRRENEQSKRGILPKTIVDLRTFLERADFVKFAKMKPRTQDIQNDRSTALQIIDALEVVFQKNKVLASSQAANPSESSFEEPRKWVSKKGRKQALLYFSGGIFALTVLLVWVLPSSKRSESMGQESGTAFFQKGTDSWQRRWFGRPPSMSLMTPMEMPLQHERVPEEARETLERRLVYAYEHGDGSMQARLTIKHYLPQKAPQLEAIIQANLQLIQTSDVEGFEYERAPVFLSDNLQGVLISGKYREKAKQKIFYLVGFVKEQKCWLFQVVCEGHAGAIENAMKKMLNSIEIDL